VRFRFNDQRDRPPRSLRVLCTASPHMQLQLLFYKMLNYHFVKIPIPHLCTKLISLSTTGALLFMQFEIPSRYLTC
jgi:hypothetical protein